MPGGLLDSIKAGIVTEEEVAIKALFPGGDKDKFRMLKMITDLPPRAVVPISILGVMQRKFKSDILKMFQEEYYLHRIPVERKSRPELAEVTAALKRKSAEKEEE